ncbi:Eco57I restriction-modification methylase domain-containing protein [Nitrobacter sp. TKz-YC01]|uniref:Eco57I restriction-modification methylase domain-containing protein n=1 Tax=Nitrobacter sp. TKz-YC01 TaxID=3398703 RepID=UPI003A0FCF61
MTNRYLPTALRRTLEKTVKDARIIAEEGAGDAIQRLGVAAGKAPAYLNDAEKELRRRLRAHARALGDAFNKSDETQDTKRLVEAAAYAHWHRMLFARFLAERGLLRNPEYDVPVSLEDCRELAEAEGLTDPWVIAERYAASMLPAVFRIDDPVLAIELDPVHTQKLHRLVTGLDVEVFQAEDSLGWTYQFWRAAEKDAVNKSGVKIGADELPAVTQLFTEPYMVRFLLHNTLGAWWAGKVLAADTALAQTAADEDTLRAACSLPDYDFDMLRFVREDKDSPWRPAAGTFPGWPKEAKAITMLDPCCGSGHFLTEALAILAALRQAEEHLSPPDAVVAVLRDNLHGLEIDGRCVQIAAFAVALTAWKVGGWQLLPRPHIAWVGAPPPLSRREFAALASGSTELEYALFALHDLFSMAPVLGSLLEPTGGDLFESEKLREIERLLEPLLQRARLADPNEREGLISARGMADAAFLLHQKFDLVITNVPYLKGGDHGPELKRYCEQRYPLSKYDLATVFLERTLHFLKRGGASAIVTQQYWLFLKYYEGLRGRLLSEVSLRLLPRLGPGAFEQIKGEVVNVDLQIIEKTKPTSGQLSYGQEIGEAGSLDNKKQLLAVGPLQFVTQENMLKNPDMRISYVEHDRTKSRLSKYADFGKGSVTGDGNRYLRKFWEVNEVASGHQYWLNSPEDGRIISGREEIVLWDRPNHDPSTEPGFRHHGQRAFGKLGVAIGKAGQLRFTPYFGELFDDNIAVVFPIKEADLDAIWNFCVSGELEGQIRILDKKMSVTAGTFTKVAFDYHSASALTNTPSIRTRFSHDPRQWLFHGHPARAEKGTALHVFLARIAGYRWPAEYDPSIRLSDDGQKLLSRLKELPDGDNDGLIGVPPVAGEKPLVDRLRAYLAAAFGTDWSDALERRLVAEADEAFDKKAARDGSLEAWVRDRAFRQHCALFGQRPFLWHISDGLKDGFSVFVHYHRFDQANLRKLTYTLLGDWLARARAENNTLRYEKGRELQQKLEKILEGEKPYDIFVRWKSLAQQPLGWDPDLDDGVRQNIRPFIKAGVLAHDLSKILKDKDRGNDVPSAPWYDVFKGERRNDHHTTLAEKRAAREAAAKRVEAAK